MKLRSHQSCLYGRLAYLYYLTGAENDQLHPMDHCGSFDRVVSQHHHADDARRGLIADVMYGWHRGRLFPQSPVPRRHDNQGDFSIPALLVSLRGAVIMLAISKLFHNIVGFLVMVIVALGIYAYFNCWTMASTSAYCASLKALPFLR
jgi:hypothetical protein